MKVKSVNLRFEDAAQHKLFAFAAKLRRMSLNGFLLYAADAVSRECQQAPDRKHDWNTVNTGSGGRCNFCGIKHKDWLSIMKLAAALFTSFMLFAPPMTQMATAQVPAVPDCVIFWKKGITPLGDLQDAEVLFMPFVTDRPLLFNGISGKILTETPPGQPPRMRVSLHIRVVLPCPASERRSPNRELHYEASNEVNQHVNVGTYPVTFVKLEPSALLPPGTLIHVFIENPAIACKVLCAMGGEITIADGVQP